VVNNEHESHELKNYVYKLFLAEFVELEEALRHRGNLLPSIIQQR